VKDVAVGEHGEERREEPGRAARGDSDQGEEAPEEEEDAESDGDFFGGGDAEEIGEGEEKKIKENVFPLPDGIDTGGSSLLDELGEPGVVHMAAEITGFNVRVPEDGNEKESGEEDDSGLHRTGESIARVGEYRRRRFTTEDTEITEERKRKGQPQREQSSHRGNGQGERRLRRVRVKVAGPGRRVLCGPPQKDGPYKNKGTRTGGSDCATGGQQVGRLG